MKHIEKYLVALKITWLRRQISQQNCTWNTLSNTDFSIYSKGDTYASLKAEKNY